MTLDVAGAFGFTVGYSVAIAMTQGTPTARFRFRVLAVIDERHLTQKSLKGQDWGESSEGWISNKLSGRRGINLDEADDIATRLHYPLSELVRRPGDRTYELDNLEARVIEAFRQLSRPEQNAFVTTITLRQRPAPYAGEKVAKALHRSAARTAAHGSPFATRPLSAELSPNVQQHVSALDQASHDEELEIARRQTPATRPLGAKKTPSDRRARKPDAG